MTATDERPDHVKKADGLRALATLIEQNPELAEHFRHTIGIINVPVNSVDEPVPLIAAFTRAAMALGARVEKEYGEHWGGVNLTWGPVGIHVYAARDKVCERVVTGTETVIKNVPDPEALAAVPTVEVTEEVETVEWVCRPLLATESEKDSAK